MRLKTAPKPIWPARSRANTSSSAKSAWLAATVRAGGAGGVFDHFSGHLKTASVITDPGDPLTGILQPK